MKKSELRQIIREEIEDIKGISFKDISHTTQKSSNFLKPFIVAKSTGFKPGAAKKYDELLNQEAESFNYTRQDLFRGSGKRSAPDIQGLEKTISTISKMHKTESPNDIGEVHYMLGPNHNIPVKYSDLEYELYKVIPTPKIERIK